MDDKLHYLGLRCNSLGADSSAQGVIVDDLVGMTIRAYVGIGSINTGFPGRARSIRRVLATRLTKGLMAAWSPTDAGAAQGAHCAGDRRSAGQSRYQGAC
eukprot:1179660-Prorocentrum_minimum.AAC.6